MKLFSKNKKDRSDSDANAAEFKAATSNLTIVMDHDKELDVMRMRFYVMQLMQRKLDPVQKVLDKAREGLKATINEQRSAKRALNRTNGTKLQLFLNNEEYERTRHAYYNICFLQGVHSAVQDEVMETIANSSEVGGGTDDQRLIRLVGEILGPYSMYAGVLGEAGKPNSEQRQIQQSQVGMNRVKREKAGGLYLD